MNKTENINDFVGDLFSEDELGAVIRGHIKIESLLIQIVELLTPKPQHLKKLNLDYDSYVTLALSLGLKDDFAPSLRAIGKLRNDFAHKPDTVLTKASCNNLYDALSKEEKSLLQKHFKMIKETNSSLKKYGTFKKIKARDQFVLIAMSIWAPLQAAVINLNNDAKNKLNESKA